MQEDQVALLLSEDLEEQEEEPLREHTSLPTRYAHTAPHLLPPQLSSLVFPCSTRRKEHSNKISRLVEALTLSRAAGPLPPMAPVSSPVSSRANAQLHSSPSWSSPLPEPAHVPASIQGQHQPTAPSSGHLRPEHGPSPIPEEDYTTDGEDIPQTSPPQSQHAPHSGFLPFDW